MKKTQRKDSLRNIKKQLVSWLSIIVISSFAVTAYLGLTYSAFGLADAGKTLYSSANFRDIQITSNCLLSEEDLNAIRNIDGIKDVEGLLRAYAKISTADDTKSVIVSSLPEKIGVPSLVAGSLPNSKDECIIEKYLAEKLALNVGDIITLTDSYDEQPQELDIDEFRISGVFIHPEHSSFDLDETYCVLVHNEAFDLTRFDDCYAMADITFEKPEYHTLFDKEYFDLSQKYEDKLEELSKVRVHERYEAYLTFLGNQITDSQKDLDDARSQLKMAEKTIPSLNGKTGQIMADMTNMLTVIFSQDPSEYKKADEQVTDYEDALKTYDNAVRKLDDAKKRQKKLTDKGECDWYIFNRNGSLDFVNLRTNSENLEKLNTSFSSLFVVIAIMVIFASLSRMVYEQRRQVGVSKALGMRNGEIFAKYLIFGLSASLIGIVLGILLSLYIIEYVIALGYEDHFVFGRFPFAIEYLPTIITVIIAILVALFSIYASCSQLLKETAKSLLSPVVPRGISGALKKSSFLSKLNLYNRMIILNMRSDIVRVCVTIISVAGCCSLVVIGFTLKQGITGAITTQMSEISKYDAKIGYNSILSETVEEEIEDILKSKNANYMRFLDKHGSIKIDDTMEYVEFLITDDIRHLSDFQTLQDWNSGEQITSSDNGIIITNRVSELYHLNIGDSIDLIDDLGYAHAVPICGITRNFIGRYAFMSKSYYQSLLDDEYSDNTFFFTCNDKSTEKEIESALDEVIGFETYTPVSELMDMFENLLIVLNLIIWLLIVLAGVMAMFVLLNLADMYLMSKRTELTIMRINGFTVKETVIYAIREVIFTSILGIIFGIIFGMIIVYSILRNMEQAHLMFVRTPSIPSCIIGAAITAIFISAIYAFSLRKVKDLSLTDL